MRDTRSTRMEFPSPSSVRCHTGCTPAASQDGGDGGREVDEAGAVAEDHRKRRKKTHIKWKVYAQGKGWAQVLLFLRTIARTECDSCELGSRGHPSSTKITIEYTFQCHYRGKPWYCDWRVKVCIERKSVSGVKWASQPVNAEDRHAEHQNDSFVIKVPADGSLLHSDHTATCSRGAHPMFVAAARDCPEMFAWSRNQIKNFIAQRHIADPVETLAHRIKKSNESARRGQVQADLSPVTKSGTLGALFAAAHGMSFASVLQKQGTAFNWNTT